MEVYVQLVGWKPGLKKIQLSHLLMDMAGMRLSDAKNSVDDLLDGRAVSIAMPSRQKAEELLREAAALGAIGHILL